MSVTSAAGFRASGVAAGLKSSGAPDVSLVVNDGPQHAAAGVFTANRFQAAPGPVERTGAQGRTGARRRAELRRRQRLHRSGSQWLNEFALVVPNGPKALQRERPIIPRGRPHL